MLISLNSTLSAVCGEHEGCVFVVICELDLNLVRLDVNSRTSGIATVLQSSQGQGSSAGSLRIRQDQKLGMKIKVWT